MKKLCLLITITTTVIATCFAQDLTKAEKKRLKDELKNYEKDLAGYKAKMEDIRPHPESNDAEIKRLKDDVAYAAPKQAEQDNKIAALEVELKRAKDENLLLSGQEADNVDSDVIAKVISLKATGGVVGGGAPMTNDAQRGIVYKIQI